MRSEGSTHRQVNTGTHKGNYFFKAARELRRRLQTSLPKEQIQQLHQINATRHFLVAGRQFVILGATTAGLWFLTNPLYWIPLVFIQGFTVFNFTILLHEAVHENIFARRRPRLNRLLGYLYAIPSGISATQFTTWHLDHHAELGSETDDPKRFRLTPKINKRWYKLLYFTPALFFIYFRAAAAEVRTYPAALRKRIQSERRVTILCQLTAALAIGLAGGWGVLTRVYMIPVFLVFPIAFVLNRLGQHYDIEPSDPAKWGTLMKPSWFWDFAFLNSNYHLEHHYYPKVPFYRLPRLHRLLKPFYEEIGLEPRTYGQLLWHYIVLNRKPHTNWLEQSTHQNEEPGVTV